MENQIESMSNEIIQIEDYLVRDSEALLEYARKVGKHGVKLRELKKQIGIDRRKQQDKNYAVKINSNLVTFPVHAIKLIKNASDFKVLAALCSYTPNNGVISPRRWEIYSISGVNWNRVYMNLRRLRDLGIIRIFKTTEGRLRKRYQILYDGPETPMPPLDEMKLELITQEDENNV